MKVTNCPIHVLVVDDDADVLLALADTLDNLGHKVCAKACAEDAIRALKGNDVDIVLTDVRMPNMSGIDLCRSLSGDRPGTPVVVMTAYGDVEAVADALRAGAVDYIAKPFTIATVADAVERAVGEAAKYSQVTRLRVSPTREACSFELIGSSAAMRRLRRQIAHVNPMSRNVLIFGESGTGKSLVAHQFCHSASSSQSVSAVVDCNALHQVPFDDCLWGQRSGQPLQNSVRDPAAQITNGTICLDNLNELPMASRVQLLRTLEKAPTNSDRSQSLETTLGPSKLRIIATCNGTMDDNLRTCEVMRDLFDRLEMIPITLPPLKKRDNDVIELARHFLVRAFACGTRSAELPPALESALCSYDWPGNVRELEGYIDAFATLSSNNWDGNSDESSDVNRFVEFMHQCVKRPSIDQLERQHIEAVLLAAGWNKVNAARQLGINRATLYRKMNRLGIQTRPEER